MEAHRALGATDGSTFVEDELAANRTFEGGSAQHGEQLLLERPMK
jgi:hypothetical protein